jgi:hypothetical protein
MAQGTTKLAFNDGHEVEFAVEEGGDAVTVWLGRESDNSGYVELVDGNVDQLVRFLCDWQERKRAGSQPF